MGIPITERSIALSIVFTIITCGIYGLYWLYKLAEETDLVLGTRSEASPAMVVVFSIITCGIYNIYWCYKQGSKFEEYGRYTGRNDAESWSVMMLVLALVNYFCGVTMLIAYALMQDKINNIVRFNNQGNPYDQGGAYANSDNING
ncbi:MAG: DUF4234 domain-containing protein [Lentihominibacter sp.]